MNRNDLDTGEYNVEELQQQVKRVRAAGSRRVRNVSVTFGAMSHAGLVRPNNEDHFLIGRLCRIGDVITTNLPDGYVPPRFEQTAYAFAVADGMGGAAAGEIASALALSLGTSLTLDASQWHMQLDPRTTSDLSEKVSEFFRLIDRALTERGQNDPGLTGMGTTLTVAYSVGLDALVFHIGDSRAYLWRESSLRQITRDETLAQAMADAGQIPAEAVSTHPMRHVLTRAMGASTGRADAVISPVRLEAGDCLLMCTDGLTDMLSDARIADVLAREEHPQKAAEALIAATLEAGGRDNVTVVIGRFTAA
jgi:PPM family protein phosphatase